MKKIEISIRIAIFIIISIATIIIILPSTELKTSLKFVSASISFLIASSSFFIPSDLIIKFWKNDTDYKTNSISTNNPQSGDNSISLVVNGDFNGNISPIYNAKKERESRKKATAQSVEALPSQEESPSAVPFSGSVEELQEQIENTSND